jgi:hypothetical protein
MSISMLRFLSFFAISGVLGAAATLAIVPDAYPAPYPDGNKYQCAASASTCAAQDGWVATANEYTVVCCCQTQQGNWIECNTLIREYINTNPQLEGFVCYREIGFQWGFQSCIPRPVAESPIEFVQDHLGDERAPCCSLR